MIVRSMIAGAAVLALATGCCHQPGPQRLATAADEAKGAVRLTEKKFSDEEGNTVTVRFEGADVTRAAEVTVVDRQGKPRDVVQVAVTEANVCLPKAGASRAAGGEPALCQPAKSVSDGAFIKMGTATCICYIFGGHMYCFGNTCR